MKIKQIIKKSILFLVNNPAIGALLMTICFGICFLIHINYFHVRRSPPTPWREVIMQKSFWISILFLYICVYINLLFNKPNNEDDDNEKPNDINNLL